MLRQVLGYAMMLTAICLHVARPAYAATVTLRPIADTALFENSPTNNLGAESTLPAGLTSADPETDLGSRNRILLKFDVASAIPTGMVVTNATLTMKVVQLPSLGRVDSTFELRRILRTWGEGNKQGAPGRSGALATQNEACWIARLYPDGLWATPGGAIGTDFSTEVAATRFVQGTGSYVFGPSTNLLADITRWQQSPASNFGWLLRSQNETNLFTNRRFGSREDTNNAPLLTLQFTMPGAIEPKIDNVVLSGSRLTFQFITQTGQSYVAEYRSNVVGGSWSALTNIPASATSGTAIVSDSVLTATRFYRLRAGP